jgi:indolepyruvate ferredoxin oxidoreductase
MMGYAWQQGRIPLSHAALMRAIELNNVQIENNKAAFEWGRRCAYDLAAVQALRGLVETQLAAQALSLFHIQTYMRRQQLQQVPQL